MSDSTSRLAPRERSTRELPLGVNSFQGSSLSSLQRLNLRKFSHCRNTAGNPKRGLEVRRGRHDLENRLWFTPPTFIKRDVKRVTSRTRPSPSLWNNGRGLGTRLVVNPAGQTCLATFAMNLFFACLALVTMCGEGFHHVFTLLLRSQVPSPPQTARFLVHHGESQVPSPPRGKPGS